MIAVRHCLWCTFTVPEDRPKIEVVEERGGGWHVTVTAPFWQLYMVRHIREEHPLKYASLPVTEEELIDAERARLNAALQRLTTELSRDRPQG